MKMICACSIFLSRQRYRDERTCKAGGLTGFSGSALWQDRQRDMTTTATGQFTLGQQPQYVELILPSRLTECRYCLTNFKIHDAVTSLHWMYEQSHYSSYKKKSKQLINLPPELKITLDNSKDHQLNLFGYPMYLDRTCFFCTQQQPRALFFNSSIASMRMSSISRWLSVNTIYSNYIIEFQEMGQT